MNHTKWILGACLSLLLLRGVAADVSAQQPAAPPETRQSDTSRDEGKTITVPSTLPGAQSGEQKESAQPAPGRSLVIDRQVETRTERVEREPAKFLGIDPTIAMVLAAVLVVVIVIGLVAVSRREEEPHHHHRPSI